MGKAAKAASVAIVLVLAIAGGCVFLAQNNNSAPADLSSSSPQASAVSKAPSSEEPSSSGPAPVFLNDLTGLPIAEDKVNHRPIAVMINNIDMAQPLLGVSQSDVMYECLVEGAITRIMACFKDPAGVAEIGSVRSARPYYIRIAQGMDAVYMHSGGSEEAYEILGTGIIDEFDLDESMSWRDAWRRENLGYEHSELTSGELLENGIANAGVRRAYNGASPNIQQFSETGAQVLSSETSATALTATFSSYKETVFEYDPSNQTYLVGQFGEGQMDGGAQNTRQNVLALYIDTYSQPDSLLQNMDLVGSGEGYYMSRGKIISILWHKDSFDTPFYYTLEDGSPLVMLPGNSYVCCVPFSGDIQYQ